MSRCWQPLLFEPTKAHSQLPQIIPSMTDWQLAGSPERIVADLKAWKQAGLQRVLLQTLDQEDLPGLELFAREVMPKL